MYVLNHKKYAYYSEDIKNGVKKGIVVKSGGIPVNSFAKHKKDNVFIPYYKLEPLIEEDKNYLNKHPEYIPITFNEFIEHEFYENKLVKNTRSILTKTGTVAIYESATLIDKGKYYQSRFNKKIEERLNRLKEEIRNDSETIELIDDVMYFETNLGTLSITDVFPQTHEKTDTDLYVLQMVYKKIEFLLK